MKKLILISTLILSPVITLAYDGVCSTTRADFCSCFQESAIQNCLEKGKKHHIKPGFCKWSIISSGIKKARNPTAFCHHYSYMFPSGATVSSCVEGLTHAKAHCM